jgi:hypothetical protein
MAISTGAEVTDVAPGEGDMIDEEFEKIGAAEVRARLATKVYLGADAALAAAWLERRNETSQARQAADATRAADAAELGSTRGGSCK